jgi:hypothetical protein
VGGDQKGRRSLIIPRTPNASPLWRRGSAYSGSIPASLIIVVYFTNSESTNVLKSDGSL